MKSLKALSILTLIFLLATASTFAAAGKLEVHDAWVREAPPNTSVMAAYLTLQNHSSKSYTLVSASSSDFNRVEMHRTEQHDGMTKMAPVSQVEISATNGTVKFQPGGMHLMLMKPKKHFVAGDSISLTLFFTDESSMKISAPVKKAAGSEDHSMHLGTHENMHNQHNEDHHNSHSH